MVPPPGHHGHVWGRLWCHTRGAPGIEWAGPGRLLSTPQRPGQPPRVTRPHCPQNRGGLCYVARDALWDSRVCCKKEPWRRWWGQSPRGPLARGPEPSSRSPAGRPLTPAPPQGRGPRAAAEGRSGRGLLPRPWLAPPGCKPRCQGGRRQNLPDRTRAHPTATGLQLESPRLLPTNADGPVGGGPAGGKEWLLQAGRAPSPHPRTPLWPRVLPFQRRAPRPGGQAAGGRRPGFPHRPWALACGPAPARAPLGLGPTVTPWDQNPSPWTRKLTSPSLSDLPPCPPCRRTLWRQGPIPTTQAGRGGLSASPGSHGRGGVGPPTPHTHRPLAPGGPPRPGRLQTHTKPAGARAADLWP